MNKNNDLTLENIGKLIDQHLEKRLAENNNSLIAKMDKGFSKLEIQIGDLKQEMAKGFDGVADGIQNIMDDLDKGADKKVKILQANLEPRVEKLEKHVFAS